MEAKRSLGDRDKVGEAEMRRLGLNRAVEAKRGRGGRTRPRMDGGHTGPLRPNEAMEVGIRLLGLNGATETRLWRPRRGHGGWDKAVEAE